MFNKVIIMKKILFLIISALSVLLISCTGNASDQASDSQFNVTVTRFKPVLLNDDHNSEGFLVTLEDGNLLLIFRLDPGKKGDHVGTDGYIAKIKYDPGKDEWGKVETVYNSNRYDDRNIHGGITDDGRVVVFFRRFDGKETEGRYFIYSDDNGDTWTEPQVSGAWSYPAENNIPGVWSTGQMFYNPDIKKYIMFGCRRYITYSRDGSSWEEFNLITDNQDYKLSEIAGAWCGNNRMIALIRDDVREHGHPLVQMETHDNGLTWTGPVPTNIPPGNHWGAAPQIIYDKNRDLLVALTSDRYSRPNEQNSLFIYTAKPGDILGNPTGWTLQHELLRPWAEAGFEGRPLNQNLYGYPTISPINEDEYLVVFTERAVMDGSEQADLYYFRMSLDKK